MFFLKVKRLRLRKKRQVCSTTALGARVAVKS